LSVPDVGIGSGRPRVRFIILEHTEDIIVLGGGEVPRRWWESTESAARV